MTVTGSADAVHTAAYQQALAGEGEFWDNFIAQRLLKGEMPGSIDWRLAFTQFRYNHHWLPFCLGAPGITFRLREIQHVLTTATRRPGMRVLDLGCGAGWLSLELARRGGHVTGVDISPTNLAIGRYMAETNARNFPFLYQGFAGLPCRLEDFGSVEYVYADLNAVSLPRGEFDAVVVWDSLHHIRDLERLLEEVRAALKPDGVFLGVDHAFIVPTPRTEVFNLAVLPWLDDFHAWLTAHDPAWLYDAVNALAAQYDWGVLAVDYDPTPVPDFALFLETLFAELLEVLRQSLRQEALAQVQAQVQAPGPLPAAHDSPFEDVSADRLMRVLLEQFRATRFTTICPWITPEVHILPYRSERERIFQHYLSALIILAGERAITHKRADGLWFLFDLTPQRPAATDPQPGADLFSDVVTIDGRSFPELDVRALRTYAQHLEAEVARKNAAITDLEDRLRRAEAEIPRPRKSHLPWRR